MQVRLLQFHLSHRQLVANVALLLMALLLAGCAGVRLIEDYDSVIDQGLTEYYESTDQFLSRMAAATASGSEEAAYENNREFYSEGETKINSLIIRARAQALSDKCIGSDSVAAVMKQLLNIEPFGNELPEIKTLIDDLKKDQQGNCTVQILTVIRANHQIMEAIHKHNDKLAQAVVNILRPTIEQGVEMALKIELAKKRGETEGGKQIAVDTDQLFNKILNAGSEAFGPGWAEAKSFARVELRTIAQRIDDIGEGLKNNEFDLVTAKLLLSMQVNLAIAAIAGATTLVALAVEQAINAILESVKDFVNGAIGVVLL